MDLLATLMSYVVAFALALEVCLSVVCPFLTVLDDWASHKFQREMRLRAMRFSVSAPSGRPFVPYFI